jgi:aspartyl-tRNA(Asn)/glutamyl-tRNA(Gln) amidotransferase subunit A
MALSWTMDKVGTMARTAEDCGHVLSAIAGHDPRDASSAKAEFAFDGKPPRRSLRLGLLPTDFAEAKAPDAEKRFGDALKVLRKLGHRTAEAELPDVPYGLAAETIITAEGASSFENLIRGPDLELLVDETQKAGLVAGLRVPAADYLRAMRIRTLAAEKAVLVFERFDALVAPTLLKGAPPADRPLSEGWTGMGGNGGPGNLLGWPSLTVPMGPDSEGLPLGIEFIGSPYDEQTILSLGIAFQRETDWHRQRPPAALTPPSPAQQAAPLRHPSP